MAYKNASDLLSDLQDKGFCVSYPVDVDSIAKHLGIEVEYDSALEHQGITGLIFTDDDEKAVVVINPIDNSYEPRRRFTLAHEIGHYCLHLDENTREFVDNRKTMSRSSSYWDNYEAEANNFAAQLLMPKNLIVEVGTAILNQYKDEEKDLPKTRDFVHEMAIRMDVSSPAMEYRLLALGILKKT